VEKWPESDYPAIASRAKQEKAEIHWGDETGIQTGANRGGGFAPKGETSIVRMVAKKSHIGMISAITNSMKVRFMIHRDAMNSELLIKFMTRSTKDAGRKVFLIPGNLRAHYSKEVKNWLKKHREQIEVFHLPCYSPELNPDEYLNSNLKTKVHSGSPVRTQSDPEKKTRSFMRTLLKHPVNVHSYFRHPRVAHAA
jgi:transposase